MVSRQALAATMSLELAYTVDSQYHAVESEREVGLHSFALLDYPATPQ